jgi:hypothetical protein
VSSKDELQPTSYQVKIKIDGAVYKEINTGTLAYREKWEQKVSFTPWLCGDGQKVEFWLYKNGVPSLITKSRCTSLSMSSIHTYMMVCRGILAPEP